MLFGGEGRGEGITSGKAARWFLSRVAISLVGETTEPQGPHCMQGKMHKLNKLGFQLLSKQEKGIQVEKGRELVNPMANNGGSFTRTC